MHDWLVERADDGDVRDLAVVSERVQRHHDRSVRGRGRLRLLHVDGVVRLLLELEHVHDRLVDRTDDWELRELDVVPERLQRLGRSVRGGVGVRVVHLDERVRLLHGDRCVHDRLVDRADDGQLLELGLVRKRLHEQRPVRELDDV